MIEVPPSARDITGGNYDSEGIMIDFFNRVREYICEEKKIDQSKYPPQYFFTIRRNPLQMSDETSPRRDLDDWVHALLYQERIVAMMIETRTQFRNDSQTFNS